MKANEVPEKIYVHRSKHVKRLCASTAQELGDIEYIRKDVFIEKACDWLNNFYNEDTHSYLIGEDIEKFIKYMKGE